MLPGSGGDTIQLGIDLTYRLDQVDNNVDGPNDLPSITSVVTINGNGSTIERDGGAPEFRICHTSCFASLALNNLTVSGGQLSWTLYKT